MQKGTCIICSAVTDAQWHAIVNITNPNFWHSRFSTLQDRQVLTLRICSCFHFKETVPSTGPASPITNQRRQKRRVRPIAAGGVWRRRSRGFRSLVHLGAVGTTQTSSPTHTYILCRVPVSCPLPAPIPRLDLLDLTFPPFAFALGPRFVSVRLVTRRRPPST